MHETMLKQDILNDIRETLAQAFGERLYGVVLYGSMARGDADADSDVDILVLLNQVSDVGRDLRTCVDVLYPLALSIERRISPRPVDINDYKIVDCPLYNAARKEGIAA